MRYILIDEPKNESGDVFTKEFDDKDAAIEEAKFQWDYLAAQEKKQRNICVLESVNPDPDAVEHMDGDIVWRCDEDCI